MRSRIHRSLFLLLLSAMAVAMTTSVFLMNLVWVLLLVNWLAEWNWKDKFRSFRSNYLLHAVLVLVAVHFVWIFVGDNWVQGFDDLRRKLPLLVVPLVLLTSPALSMRERFPVVGVYLTTVLVVSFVGLVRFLTVPNLPYREIVPFISHIRFGLNVCLAIVILLMVAARLRGLLRWLCLAVALWFVAFLMLIQSYTSFIVLAAVSLVAMVTLWHRFSAVSRRVVLTVVVVVAVVSLGGTAKLVYDYYHLSPLASQPLASCTANGNPYHHERDGFVENGNYVNDYVCEVELRSEWPDYSDVALDELSPLGYTVYPALVRYLNARGLTKDSVGLSHLSEVDIRAIEQGIANPVYLRQGSPRKMVYTLLFEYENFRHYDNVRNFSMLQRFELWNNAVVSFLSHPVLGVGTGDVVDATQHTMLQRQSPLYGYPKYPHSQYLTFLLSFGLVGFSLILFFFVRALRNALASVSFVYVAFWTVFLVSCLSEDTLQTMAGIAFFTFFYSLFSRPCPENVQNSDC